MKNAVENQTGLQLKERATGLIATLTRLEDAREYERKLTTAKAVQDGIPLCVMVKHGGRKGIAQAIDIQLTRLVGSLNLGHNLNDAQIKNVVEDLMDKYPNESVEDFILVFKKARLGEFGTIYNLHSAVIFQWMEQYLEEKYRLVEENLHNEKEKYREQFKKKTDLEWIELWNDACKQAQEDAEKEGATGHATSVQLQNYRNHLKSLTGKEIREEGQEQPKRVVYPSTDEAYHKKFHLHNQWIRENFDKMGNKLPGWLPEDQWIKQNNL